MRFDHVIRTAQKIPTFAWLFFGFFGVRAASFLLTHHTQLQNALGSILLIVFIFLYKKNPFFAWLVLLSELALGGSGHMIEIATISVRTALTGLFIFLYTVDTVRHREWKRIKIPKTLFRVCLALAAAVLLAVIRAFLHGHSFELIIKDAIPYGSFLLLFPALTFIPQYKQHAAFLRSLVSVFILGNAVFSLFTLWLFSSQTSFIQGAYYKWFRDVAAGKITDMGTGFFRIVLPEHLLLIPLILILFAWCIKQIHASYTLRLLIAAAIVTVVINFSRMYLLVLIITFPVFLYKQSFLRWSKEFLILSGLIVTGFTSLHFAASNFTSFGFELFSARAKSIVQPYSEESSTTRMTLLGPIEETIRQYPVLGSGLGATLSLKNNSTTNQFDWGYFEMWAELGLLGLVVWLLLVGALLGIYAKQIPQNHDALGMVAGLSSLGLLHITIPALFHVFGICFVVFCIVLATQKNALDIPK